MPDGDRAHTESPESPEGVRSITVQLDGLEEVTPQFANIVHANNDRQAFQLVFSQLMPPVILGPEDREALFRQGAVSAKVVARIILTPLVLEQFIDVLRTQLGQYQESQEEPPAGAAEPTDG